MYKQRNARLLNDEGKLIFYEDIGRPIEVGDGLDELKHKVNQIALKNSCKIIYKRTPNIVYALGSEIKSARQNNNSILTEATSSEQVILKLKSANLVPDSQFDYGLTTRINWVKSKPLKKDNLKDIRLTLKDIPNFDGEGSLIYDERHAFQFSLGLLRPMPSSKNIDNSIPHKPTPITLILGVFRANTPSQEKGLLDNLNEKLINQSIMLGKISVFNAFANQTRYN